MAKRKRTNNDLQNITQKTKNRATLKPLKPDIEPRGLAVPAPHVTPVALNDIEN
jgi:regulator of sirC expression with transglutaminase-like and TPR domain